MPELRLAKARATLPKGYQFGDAKHCELSAVSVLTMSAIDWFMDPDPVFLKTLQDGRIACQQFADGLILREQGEWHGGN